jgi:hypothetical protein
VHRTTVWQIVHIGFVVCLLWGVSSGVDGRETREWPQCTLEQVGGLVRLRCRRAGMGRWGYRRQFARRWQVALLRSLLLWGLWELSGRQGWGGWWGLPWLLWLWPSEWGPGRRLQPGLWELQRVVLLSYVGLDLVGWVSGSAGLVSYGGGGALACLVCGGTEPYVAVERQADGSYQATVCGHFTLGVAGDQPFRVRLLLIVLGLLQSGQDGRGSRRTRDGRTPFVRQEQLAAWFGVAQEHVSRFNRYWLLGDWASLLSLPVREVLTPEWVARIVTVAATFPHWPSARVYHYLRQHGLGVSQAQVEQALAQSGWQQLQAMLQARRQLTEPGVPLQEQWLIQQLLGQVQALLERLEQGGALLLEEQWALSDLQRLAAEAGVPPARPWPVQPWLQVVEPRLLRAGPSRDTPGVQCPYCGSMAVGPKSQQARWKRYYDAHGQVQQVAVYRYYCHHPACSHQSFTHLPPGLTPYSPYRIQWHLLALQAYAWGYSTYRRTGTALGVSSMTAWRWVSAWGHELLPVAALFGVVKSSGVVGVDEKYVLVPKNDKPADPMRRWMYVYLAVDVWSYDLLHIAIYAHNNQHSAHAFLLALRAKGYHPQVLVTDLRQDYGPLIAQVFPQAVHHECIFHALQQLQQSFKDVYGAHYPATHPEAEQLKQRLYQLFDTSSAAEAEQRYQAVRALQPEYVARTPGAQHIFDFLERHWPKLVNAIGSDRIPTTNNTVELVIRRFDQHYQNFCGFESLESAQCYLAVFEKLYRFTPFSQDAQPRIRGKSPLQLAGYDVAKLPMSALCAGLSLDWPLEVAEVPNL